MISCGCLCEVKESVEVDACDNGDGSLECEYEDEDDCEYGYVCVCEE